MLGVRNYSREYIEDCRAKVAADVSAYRKLVAASKGKAAGNKVPAASSGASFEAAFFNNMVLVLDHLFVHRLRTIEGKDGNPLNEVRVISDSIMLNKSRMAADKTIKLSAATSVIKYQVGDEINLSEAQFLCLSKPYLDEIERRYL